VCKRRNFLTAPLEPEVVLGRKLERTLIENANLRSMNKKLMRGGGFDMASFVQEFTDVLKEEKQKPFVFNPLQVKKQDARSVPPVSKDHFEFATCVWSDWHISEVVRYEDANQVNAYNSLIAANRIAELVHKTKTIIRLHEAMYPIKELWIPILGDMINGSIHPELLLTNDLSDPAATILCARLLQMALLDMRSLGIPIKVDCIVGNHPRMMAKMPTKIQAHVSFDWIIYEMLADYFKGDKLIQINVHTGQIAIVEKLGWRYVIEHGIDVRNGHEEEFEDRIRALFDDPVYRASTGLTGTAFDTIVIGNLHKPAFLERTIKNGSLTGQNELGQSWRLKPIKAQQLMFGISKSHLRTWQYPVDVTSIISEKTGNAYSDFTKIFMKRHGRSTA
jgi:hypothetical protein